MHNEISYRGYRIVQLDEGLHKSATFGFNTSQSYAVLDEWDDNVFKENFWTAREAVAAIEMKEVTFGKIAGDKWPTTVKYEYDVAMRYWQNFYWLYDAIIDIRANTTDASAKERLDRLHHLMMTSGARTME